MEFASRVLSADAPMDGSLGGVAPDLISVDGSSQCHFVAVASLQEVSGQHAELYVGHIEPTGVFGRVVKLEALHNAAGFDHREGLVERRRAVDVQSLPRT